MPARTVFQSLVTFRVQWVSQITKAFAFRFPLAYRRNTVITLEFLQEQLHARPFVPFVLVLSSGDRYNIKTADHADLPPADEETGERNPWFIVYNQRGIPRYLALENIAALEHSGGSNGA
jgi:hypothetical protein